MIQYFKTDTLFLHADTLKATYDSTYFSLKKIKENDELKNNKGKKGKKVKDIDLLVDDKEVVTDIYNFKVMCQ